MEIDIWMILGAFMFFVGLPCLGIFIELRGRSKYPIRVNIRCNQGSQTGGNKTIEIQDRIGFVDTTDEKGANTGAKHWRLRRLNRQVLNFSYDYVFEKFIWFGLKRVPTADIYTKTGEKGEEFFPIAFTDDKNYRPILGENRAIHLMTLLKDIHKRNQFVNWLTQNMMEIIKIGLELAIVVMLFLVFMNVGDWVDGLKATGGNCQLLHNDFQQWVNVTNATTAQPIRQVGGIPFAVG
jgi:hypothetical protein